MVKSFCGQAKKKFIHIKIIILLNL